MWFGYSLKVRDTSVMKIHGCFLNIAGRDAGKRMGLKEPSVRALRGL